MSLVTKIKDLEGTLVLDLTPAGGYRRETLDSFATKWRRIRHSSTVVDGQFETQRAKDSVDRTEVIKVTGADWVEVEERTLALEAAACEDAFLWVVGRDSAERTYRTVGPADSDSSFTREDYFLKRRFVVLSFTVQPNYTMTLPEEP